MSRARRFARPFPSSHASRKRTASLRRQKKQGRCPAASAVASSRKNSSVQLRREVMSRRSWTELFFLDEATALAAGHLPCFFCRRNDAVRFREAWEEGNGLANLRARDIDAVLHRQRLDHGKKRLHQLPAPL